MAKFRVEAMSLSLKNTKGKKYPSMVRLGTVETSHIAEEMAGRTGSARSDVMGVLTAVSEVMAQQMALGYNVRLDGIGIFSPKLGWEPDAEPEYTDSTMKRNAQSVEVSGVNYRADKKLVRATNARADLQPPVDQGEPTD